MRIQFLTEDNENHKGEPDDFNFYIEGIPVPRKGDYIDPIIHPRLNQKEEDYVIIDITLSKDASGYYYKVTILPLTKWITIE